MAFKWVKGCCPEMDKWSQTEFGAWVRTGKIGNQKVTSEFHAEHQAQQKAYREAVASGDIDRVLDIKFKEEQV